MTSGTTMNHFEAHEILDKVKTGFDYPENLVIKALILTGDIDEHTTGIATRDGSEGMAGHVQTEVPGSRERSCLRVVARDVI
jgi:hypothetical protein